ncbi:MAG: GTPase HflX [Desulfitobacteriia bacterium]|jgi:GTP-binding protein HflX
MNKIKGEISGIKRVTLEQLEDLYEYQIPPDQLWTEELIEEISLLSEKINREIALYIDRKGRIIDIRIGDHNTVTLSPIESRRSPLRLSGVRCIHTHLKGSGRLSLVDISALKHLRLDTMIAVGIRTQELYVGILSSGNQEEVALFGPYPAKMKDFQELLYSIAEADQRTRDRPENIKQGPERALLVSLGVEDISIKELRELAKTAGAKVVGEVRQKYRPQGSVPVGSGKLEEIRLMIQTLDVDLVIFDGELSGTEQRNFEQAIGCPVLCRTALILDIFAQRARSREGILQVELAQLEYQLTRLIGSGSALSRLGGGIGTRGPGETKLETDRRNIRTRIVRLKKELAEIRKQRGVLRSSRQKSNIPIVSLVGYTNAGKSTLLNTLCEADVFVEDKLFATLDTTVRKLDLDNGQTILLTDTVGFIRNLPPELLDAFKSTLEETVLADLILLVADASDPEVEEQIRIVDDILRQLKVDTKQSIIVLNKIDLVSTKNPVFLTKENRVVIETSAVRGDGIGLLKETLQKIFFGKLLRLRLRIPFTQTHLLAWLYENAKVLNVDSDENGIFVQVEIVKSLVDKVAEYRVY